MAYANLEKDKWFLEQIEDGFLKVDKDGTVTNLVTNKVIGSSQGEYVRIGVKDHIDNKINIILAHRLVWIAFNGLIKYNYLQINHKDGNKRNNKLSNLEITDNSGNVTHAFKIGLNKVSDYQRKVSSERLSSENNPNSVFYNGEISALRKQFLDGLITINEICKNYNISRRSVRNMLSGITYSNIKENIVNNSLLKFAK
jgi:hypothetical protein